MTHDIQERRLATVPRIDETTPVFAQAVRQLTANQPYYRTYHDYYDGRHVLTFATEKFKNAFGNLFKSYAENICQVVVDSVVDRLIVSGFEVESGPKSAMQDADAIWSENRMDALATAVHEEAVRAGDAYVIVWPDDDGRPVIHYQDGAMVTVRYDSETRRTVQWAAKYWLDEPTRKLRITLYYPDRIEKWISKKAYTSGVDVTISEKVADYEQYTVEGEPWPLPNPYGRVPVFGFHNTLRPGHLGRSELVNVIPIQNAINKERADMLVASEFVAFPQRYATGIALTHDPVTGETTVPFEPGVERFWATPDRDAEFGQFPESDMKNYIETINSLYQSAAVVSATPLHHLVPVAGGWPSGEALKTAESRYVKKIQRKQVVFGNTWEDVFTFAREEILKATPARLAVDWESAEPRSDAERLTNLEMKKRLGIPPSQLWSEAGYTSDEIETMAERQRTARTLTPAELLELARAAEIMSRLRFSPEYIKQALFGLTPEEISEDERSLTPEQMASELLDLATRRGN